MPLSWGETWNPAFSSALTRKRRMSLSSSARRILCMAVSRRTRLGGSLRPLSPTEGKFRVKGNYFLATAGGAISVATRTKIDQGGAFQAFATPSRRTAAFFAWQNDYDYGQYILTKPSLRRQNRSHDRSAPREYRYSRDGARR